MSGEVDSPQRVASPLSSGRASPSPFKSRQRDEDNLLKKDKGYRRYASTVERVLSQFDTSVEEWADYITFLGRLLKALSVKPSGFSEIPHKFLVAKRLSQCLNPILPSGVHQKTLEVYSYVFSTLGKDGLATDLGLYLPGLSPVLSFAALSVKPNVLSVFETYIVPLKASAIRSALKSILLALLPGLEEENSDEFDRVLRILAALKASIARDAARSEADGEQTAACEQYFWQCMFLAGITSTTRRPGTLAYLIRDLPQLGDAATKTGHQETNTVPTQSESLRNAIDSVVSPEPGLLIRCLCAGLQDDRPLIQRGFLDLLVTHLPLDSVVLQERVLPADLSKLVISATSVVARKDMSLNRRLWSWFLGPEPTSESNGTLKSPVDMLSPTHNIAAHQTDHFNRFGLQPLVTGLSSIFGKDNITAAEHTKALRICQSLMDKWEIGGLVGPQIFILVMDKVRRFQASDSPLEAKNEVLRSANMFFDGVESCLIWTEIFEIMLRATSATTDNPNTTTDMLESVYFMVTNFNIREEEMQTVHIPLIILVTLVLLQQYSKTSLLGLLCGQENLIASSLKIVSRLLDLVPARALVRSMGANAEDELDEVATPSPESILTKITTFYKDNKGNIDVGQPFSAEVVGQAILEQCLGLITKLISLNSTQSYSELGYSTSLLRSMMKKGSYSRPNLDDFLDVILTSLDELQTKKIQVTLPFAVTVAKVAVIDALFSSPESSNWISLRVLRNVLPGLVHELWPALSALRPKHNVEAARALWTLYGLCEEKQLIDSTIVTLMIHEKDSIGETFIDEENARRFTVLWTHTQNITIQGAKQTESKKGLADISISNPSCVESLLERPLMLLLDSLDDSTSSLFPFVAGWLQSLPSLIPIFDLLLARLSALYPILSITQPQTSAEIRLDDDPDGLYLCYYYLQMIYNVIQHSKDSVWEALSMRMTLFGDHEKSRTAQDILADIAIRLLQNRQNFQDIDPTTRFRLAQVSLSLMRTFYNGPFAAPLVESALELPLINELVESIKHREHLLQTSLMEVVLAALRPHYGNLDDIERTKHKPVVSRERSTPASPRLSSSESDAKRSALKIPPVELLDVAMLGLRSPNTWLVLESWTNFLGQCLEFYREGLFQILLPLIACFCDTLMSLLKQTETAYSHAQVQNTEILDPTMTILLNGLEQTLATAHDVLTVTQANAAPAKSPEPQQGSFFSSMAGVFSAETAKTKVLTANDRLTVLLCFKDAMKICYSIWTWGDSSRDSSSLDGSALGSYKWTALKLRNRTRKIFEHLFAAEALECLETLIDLWQNSTIAGHEIEAGNTFGLLNVLESSRPKVIMPAIFNAIYSRTKPAVLEVNRTSSLTSNLSNVILARFLVTYVKTLDDDAMDEIWNDCITFLKDVLADVLPHSQTLPLLIEFTALLGHKVDNTTFGEQPKLRRELGDLFIRLLRANLAIKPMGSTTDSTSEKSTDGTNGTPTRETRYSAGSEGLVAVLSIVVPNLGKVVFESDRIGTVSNTISTDIVGPIFRAKAFPENVNNRVLELIQALLNVPEATKSIKRDINEAFNDARFFSTPLPLVKDHWLPILQSWSLADKEKMPELLSRLVTPAPAGVLGIGASSGRIEADKKAQRDLRRIALLILSAAKDTYIVNLSLLQDRIIDLLRATTSSSPSLVTRSEVYIVIRALLLKTSPTHLSPFWPTIHTEIYETLSSCFPSEDVEPPNPICLLQACKLLETLLVLGIDDFQMQEWLFISDTTDAVYRPAAQSSVALVDNLAEALDEQSEFKPGAEITSLAINSMSPSSGNESRRPLLLMQTTKEVPKEAIVDRLIRPFFRQLSISAFESTYDLQTPDWDACFREVVADLFDDSTLV